MRSGFRQRAPASLTPARRLNFRAMRPSRSVRQTAFPSASANSNPCRQNAAQITLLFPKTNFRSTGKPRSRTRHREDYNSPEKFRMECVLEKPVAPLAAESATCRTISASAMLAAELVLWSWRRESNPRPSDYKSDALPTELRQQLGKGAFPRKLIPRIPSRCPGQLFKVSQGKERAQPYHPLLGAPPTASSPVSGTSPNPPSTLASDQSRRPGWREARKPLPLAQPRRRLPATEPAGQTD